MTTILQHLADAGATVEDPSTGKIIAYLIALAIIARMMMAKWK